ncbi:MAG: thioredoxin domain-containing protein [Candidatus Portnoybacteria bacterium]
MNNKTIILSIIAVAVLAGIVWYSGLGDENQTASIVGGKESEKFSKITEDFVLGDPDAPVTIVEYSSHFCGHCVDFHKDTLPTIIEQYVKTGKVKIIPKLLSSLELNSAVLCAQEQGKYWEYNEYLFEHVNEISSVDDLNSIAGDLGLEQESFDACYDSGKYEEEVRSAFEQAQAAGVEGTPTFFINDQEVVGNQPFEVFEKIIEELLK